MTRFDERIVTPPSNERAASAVLGLLKITARSEETMLSVDDIMFVTQASEAEVAQVLGLLREAGLLRVSSPSVLIKRGDQILYPRKTFAMALSELVLIFGDDVWKDDSPGSRLGVAYSGDGDFNLSGWQGQDNDLLRHWYVETKFGENDSQSSRITAKGRAVYLVLSLLFPRPTLAEAVRSARLSRQQG
ncbi:hypothetical protein O9X98_08990 [Agrobacterium salinitolerans]|nr:hypothetical protein [Agrobacterium salinitolerans]